jgi:adenine-specific DNA-methyltransferase
LHERAAPWKNLIIEGDNFDALRWLRMTWAGRIKCIYVDPPYNTGNKDWVYNDRFFSADDRWRHSTWLEFLYRRFTLARDLLTEDGALLVSINDENRAKLELMLDEIMPGKRLGSFVWRTRVGGNEGGESFLSDNHEHVLAYGNKGFRFGGTEKSFEKYSNADCDPRGDWRPDNLTVSVAYTDKRAGQAFYPLHDESRDVWYPCNPDAVWRFGSKAKSKPGTRVKTKWMEQWIATGQILFPTEDKTIRWESFDELITAIRSGNVPTSGPSLLLREGLPDLEFWVGKTVGFGTPAFKRFKKDLRRATQPLSSWVTPQSEKATVPKDENAIISGTNDQGAKEIKDIFGEKAFNYAKPSSLLRGLVDQATSPGDTVLDFFAGSGTTAQAVMSLNAEDHGDRRFILVSSTEATAEEPDKNLCRDVAATRIRKLNASDEAAYADLNAEFAYLRCRTLPFEDIDYDLQPPETWAALEALHQLPLTKYAPAPWTAHKGKEQVLVYVDNFTPDLVPFLLELSDSRTPTFVYAWAPGQIREAVGDAEVEIRSVRDTLVARFRQ